MTQPTLKEDNNIHNKHAHVQNTANPAIYTSTMGWLGDRSHRGHGRQAWTAVGCRRGTPSLTPA